MLSRGALRCVVPACSVGMAAVVCGGVTWTAGVGFSGNAKNVIFCSRFLDDALISILCIFALKQ